MRNIRNHVKNMKNLKVKKIFRRNQIIITTLAVMIAAAGYLNYAGKGQTAAGDEVYEAGMMEISDEDILAENQAAADTTGMEEIASLDNDPSDEAAGTEVEEATMAASGEEDYVLSEDTSDAGIDNPGEAVLTSGGSVSEYIAGVQLNREQVRARNKETLNEIINNQNLNEAAKEEAVQNMVKMTEAAEKENAAETLLSAKGFADPVVSITGEKVDVVINASSITDPERAQIEDIVKRKTEVGAENIVITLLNTEE
ncbi:MAG TPA: SpoIIIAH-like family protein [Candidatus Lachnoclostridium avicola]|nr:SpoIIIAH-like family protein [Candidatus Lachnoclostridium avicola]